MKRFLIFLPVLYLMALFLTGCRSDSPTTSLPGNTPAGTNTPPANIGAVPSSLGATISGRILNVEPLDDIPVDSSLLSLNLQGFLMVEGYLLLITDDTVIFDHGTEASIDALIVGQEVRVEVIGDGTDDYKDLNIGASRATQIVIQN